MSETTPLEQSQNDPNQKLLFDPDAPVEDPNQALLFNVEEWRPETQDSLFEIPEEWEKHWKNMPEFLQKDLRAFKSIIVHFESFSDMKKFQDIVGQTVTLQTKSMWFPEAAVGHYTDKRYVDAVEDSATEGVETMDDGAI